MRRAAALLAVTLFAATAALAAAQPSASISFRLRAASLGAPPVIDGIVNDNEWQGAAMATDFIQFQPQRGAPASVRTVALVARDASFIYVAFRCWDDQPLTARLSQRHSDLLSDDSVVVVLDTAHDRRTGYYFFTNPLGSQADGRITDDGREVRISWREPR